VRCYCTGPFARGASGGEAGGGDGDVAGDDYGGDDDDDDDDGGNDEAFEPITITEDEVEVDGEAGSTATLAAVTGDTKKRLIKGGKEGRKQRWL
jgi:hypothetical protein